MALGPPFPQSRSVNPSCLHSVCVWVGGFSRLDISKIGVLAFDKPSNECPEFIFIAVSTVVPVCTRHDRKPRETHGPSVNQYGRPLRLPNEIIIEIVKLLPLCRVLNALTNTCCFLYKLLNMFLYKRRALDDNYALLWVARNCVMATANIALSHGANINATVCEDSPTTAKASDTAIRPNEAAEPNEWHGSTPLFLAICGNHEDVVRLLLRQQDIQLNRQTAGEETALHIAA